MGGGRWERDVVYSCDVGAMECNGQSVAFEIQRPGVQTQDPSGAQEQLVRVFPSHKCCGHSLSECPTPVCFCTHTNEHVRTLKIVLSMSEFGGLRKHEKIRLALVGLSSAALAPAVVLPR